MGENTTKLNSFNIFDEETINEFESNPNSTKFPMSKFSFFENGTISEINLPKDMDKYHAQVMIELIDNIVVKLIRNEKEEKNDGITIKLNKENSNKTIITEKLSEREYSDKYTKMKYKGSKFSKSIVREIEDNKINRVRTDINLNLQTQKKENDLMDFGLDNYNLDFSSDIFSTGSFKDQKELVKLVNKLSEKFEFIKSDELIHLILSKEQEQMRKKQNDIIYASKEKVNLFNGTNLRKLKTKFDTEFSFTNSWVLCKFDIFGETITISYDIEISKGVVENHLVLDAGIISLKIGNLGVTDITKDLMKINDIPLFVLLFIGVPFPISFQFIISGNCGFQIDFTKTFSLSINGELSAKAEVSAGIKGFISLDIGDKGVLIGIASTSIIPLSNDIKLSHSIKIYTGEVSLYARGQLFIWEIFYISITIIRGWSKTFN